MLARASGLFRMMAQVGAEWEHVTDSKLMESSLLLEQQEGPNTRLKNLAPPILIDGNVTISQAISCHMYLGNKFGFNKGIPFPELALQYMNDLDDLHDEMKSAFMQGDEDVNELQKFLTGDRYKTMLATINNQIKGPYYFGNDATYVDFCAVSFFEMCDGRWLNPLLDKTGGDTVSAHAPKLREVIERTRSLESAAKLKDIPALMPSRILSPERVATWKS